MKTIICGPPHSGKSVLISNLIRLMPSDAFLRINANGDGEGTWSNNPDQDEVMGVRVKTGNTPGDFATWERRIRNASKDIVIIDIGGRILDDKIPLFKAADSFVILSSDPSMLEPWREFGEKNGCRCIAMIESRLDGEDFIESDNPLFKARICGLERGSIHTDSAVLRGLAEEIVRLSGYKRTELVDFFEIGKELGCSLDWTTKDDVLVTHIHFEHEKAPVLWEMLTAKYRPHTKYRLYHLNVNWVAVIAANTLGKDGLSLLSFYDGWTDSFITPCVLKKKKVPDARLGCSVRETENAVYLSFVPEGNEVDTRLFRDYVLPEVGDSKPMFLSGRFPTWFVVSVLGSYASSEQYILQPGNHYICVKSDYPDRLGRVVNPIGGGER